MRSLETFPRRLHMPSTSGSRKALFLASVVTLAHKTLQVTAGSSEGSTGTSGDGSSDGSVESYPVDIPPMKVNGTNYNYSNETYTGPVDMNITGVDYTDANTISGDLDVSTTVLRRLFPELARQLLIATNRDVITANMSGFSIPVGFILTTLFDAGYSATDPLVVLEGTPFRETPGLSAGDYIESDDPIEIPGDYSSSSGPLGRRLSSVMSPIFFGSFCSSWEQNVLITQFGIGALTATCIEYETVKSADDIANCIRRMLPRLSAPAGYENSSWNTNCFVCVNEAVQSMNLWDQSVRTACNDAASDDCPVGIVAMQFANCAGFDALEPTLAPFCDYTYNSAELFQSMVNTCIDTAQSDTDMKSCVQFTAEQWGVTGIDANCVSAWSYLLESVNRLTDKQVCQDNVISSDCRSALSKPLANFVTWAGFDPTYFYYYADDEMGPGPEDSGSSDTSNADSVNSAESVLGYSTMIILVLNVVYNL